MFSFDEPTSLMFKGAVTVVLGTTCVEVSDTLVVLLICCTVVIELAVVTLVVELMAVLEFASMY